MTWRLTSEHEFEKRQYMHNYNAFHSVFINNIPLWLFCYSSLTSCCFLWFPASWQSPCHLMSCWSCVWTGAYASHSPSPSQPHSLSPRSRSRWTARPCRLSWGPSCHWTNLQIPTLHWEMSLLCLHFLASEWWHWHWTDHCWFSETLTLLIQLPGHCFCHRPLPLAPDCCCWALI